MFNMRGEIVLFITLSKNCLSYFFLKLCTSSINSFKAFLKSTRIAPPANSVTKHKNHQEPCFYKKQFVRHDVTYPKENHSGPSTI